MAASRNEANGNVHVTVNFTSSDNPARVQQQVFFGNDIDRGIDTQITKYIAVLRRQDAAYDALLARVGHSGQG